jgi:hypothetical protein
MSKQPPGGELILTQHPAVYPRRQPSSPPSTFNHRHLAPPLFIKQQMKAAERMSVPEAGNGSLVNILY